MSDNPYELQMQEWLPRIFKYTFERNAHPEWLISPQTGKQLEIDFYSEEGNIAIEIQSKYHYHPKYMAYNRRFLDHWKKDLIQSRGIRYIIIDDTVLNKMKQASSLVPYFLKRSYVKTGKQSTFVVRDGYLW